MKRAKWVLVFDGGSRGNPGPGYGSYALIGPAEPAADVVRLDFGARMTSNEAEYDTLIAALEDLIARVTKMGRSPADFSVEVRGDSRLIINQVSGAWKAKDERMRARRDRVRELLHRFGSHELKLQPRRESVRLLGH
ncbi:MAG TPA: reverse transcriptase-like protein [Anaerolineae bacterium]|nr:reverse transcriptase-like protein [Anaerolineae bacterium]